MMDAALFLLVQLLRWVDELHVVIGLMSDAGIARLDGPANNGRS